jgi:microcompartment protein CcmL/EutN
VTALYVYGVTRASSSFGATDGIGGAPVELVVSGDVAAVASALATEARARKADLVRHSAVLQDAAGAAPVLPLRFGTVFESREAVEEELLQPRHEELSRLLDEFEGTVELDLKVSYRDQDAMLREVVNRNPQIARLNEATRVGGDAAYFDRIRLGELVGAAVAARRDRDAGALLARLEPLTLDARVEPDVAAHEVLKAAFLVAREQAAAFDAEAEALARERSEELVLKLVGPLPPFSFVALTRHESAAPVR